MTPDYKKEEEMFDYISGQIEIKQTDLPKIMELKELLTQSNHRIAEQVVEKITKEIEERIFKPIISDIDSLLEEITEKVVNYIWEHRTADSGDIIYAKFSKKGLEAIFNSYKTNKE